MQDRRTVVCHCEDWNRDDYLAVASMLVSHDKVAIDISEIDEATMVQFVHWAEADKFIVEYDWPNMQLLLSHRFSNR